MTGNFPQLLHAFFHEWLAGQRNNSRHTVRSYRDTWRLFLRFMAAQQQRPVAALRLADLTASEVLAFLDHSEKERSVSIGTRNCRLAALRSFCAREHEDVRAKAWREAALLRSGSTGHLMNNNDAAALARAPTLISAAGRGRLLPAISTNRRGGYQAISSIASASGN